MADQPAPGLTINGDEWIDVDQLCEWLGFQRAWVLDRVQDGTIPHYKFSYRLIRFRMSEINAWIEHQKRA